MVCSGGPETLLGDLCVRRACGCFNGGEKNRRYEGGGVGFETHRQGFVNAQNDKR